MAGSKEATNEVYANSDLDDDGVHGDRMKPLSSLGIPAKKGSNSSAKFSSSQVLTMAKVGTKARHRRSLYGNGKRNAIIRIQRMHARSKKCKKIYHKGSRHGETEDKLTALPNFKNRAEYLKATKDKDMDSASNLTCEGLEASTKVFDSIISSSREPALSCFQEQNYVDFFMPYEDLPVLDLSVPDAVARLAPEVHLNSAESGEERTPLPSTELLKKRIPNVVPLTQEDNIVNPLRKKCCIDPMLKNMLTCLAKTKNEDEFVACGVVAAASTCNSMHVTKGYCESIKTTPSCFQSSDVLYDGSEIKRCIKPSKAEPGLPFQTAGKYGHAFRTKYSHATCFSSHSENPSWFTKHIKVGKTAVERFFTTNSKMIKSQQSMGKQGASPRISGDLDVLKQIRELNPGIINKLRDKKQVHAALEAIIGASTANAISSEKKDPSLKVEKQHRTSGDENQGLDCQSEGRPSKRRKSIDYRLRPAQMSLPATGNTAVLVDMKTQATDMDTMTQATDKMAELERTDVYSTEQNNSCKHLDTDARVYKNPSLQASDSIHKNLSVHKVEDETDLSKAKQQRDSSTNFLSEQTIPCQERSHVLLQVADKNNANAASCWLELLRLDIKGRLSALKRSRRRIQSVIASGQLEDQTYCADDAFQKTSRWDMVGGGKRDSQTVDVDKWRVFFLQMDSVLHSEGARLENWLNQIDEMQSYCQKEYCKWLGNHQEIN